MKTHVRVDYFLLIVFLTGCATAPTLVPATQAPPTSPPAEASTAPVPTTWTDEFNGPLAPGWRWLSEDPSHWNLTEAPGVLRIVTQGESLYLGGRPKNLLVRDAPAGDFEIITKVTFDPSANFQQAAILIYQDDDNFVLLNRGFCDVGSCPGNGVFLDNERQGENDFGSPRTAASLQTTWLRLRKEGATYLAYYSADGQSWTELGRVENPMQPTKVGLTANNSNPNPSVPQIPADYELFTLQEPAAITLAQEAAPTAVPSAAEADIAPDPAALTPGQVVAEIPVGHVPFRLAIGEGAIWVTDQNDAAVYRIDPQTNHVVATILVGKVPKGVAVGEGAVWVANAGGTTVSQIDPQTNQVAATIEVGAGPRNVEVGAGAVWVASGSQEGIVSRIDPATNQVIATIKVEAFPTQVAVSADASAVWVASKDSHIVSRIDPGTNQVVATIDVGLATLALAAGQEAVWVAGESEPTLIRIDPQTNQVVAQIAVGKNSWAVAAGTDAIWITSNADDTLWRIDPQTNQVVASFKVGKGPLGVAVGEGGLWVVNSFSQAVWRIRP